MDNITLYFRDGPSDKVYQASIHPKDHGFLVYFAYGRRGSTLNTGTKTTAPVTYKAARSIFDKLIKEKIAKGYTQGADASILVHTGPKKHSGINCQLLNPVSEGQAQNLINDPKYWMQEKMDGRRLILKKEDNIITGINRLGFNVAVPQTLIDSTADYDGDFILDGEAVGDTLHAFDLLSVGWDSIRHWRFCDRYYRLWELFKEFDHPHIQIVDTSAGSDKQDRFDVFMQKGKEGVVFKNVDAPYTPGRPNAGGTQLKYKFYETASFIVTKPNPKRSVSLILFEGDKVRGAGNVTIPPNHDIPAPGTVVECRYLYAFKESGSIYQPVFLGPREDILADECTTAQLKYKAGVLEAAA